MASQIRNAGKIFSVAKAYRFLPKNTITTQTRPLPCPFSSLDYECLRRCATKQADFFDSLTYKPPPPVFHEVLVAQLAEYASLLSPFMPLAALLASNHAGMFAYLVWKNPDYIKGEILKVKNEVVDNFWNYRGFVKRFLAGISTESFNRFCAIANFMCSPAKTTATYKDFFIDEIKSLRQEGEFDLKAKEQKFDDWFEYSTNEDFMFVSFEPCCPDGERLKVFVCSSYLIIIGTLGQGPVIAELPKFSFQAKSVSATLKSNKLLIQFLRCHDVDTNEEDERFFRIPIECF